jgi:AraC family transcriptional regulator, dual regulator of chb operon
MQRLLFHRLGAQRGFAHLAPTKLRGAGRTALHTHDFPELFLVVGGEGKHLWNGREIPLARGHLAYVAPSDAHAYATESGAGLEFWNLALDPAWWARFCALQGRDLEPVLRATLSTAGHLRLPEAGCALHQAAFAAEHGRESECGTPGLVALVAALVASLCTPSSTQAQGGLPPWLASLQRDLEDAQLCAKPLAFWQRRSGRSPEHFARTCRAQLGQSPTELLNAARIRHVCARLRGPGEPKITELAGEAGFENLAYFYRVFRNVTGHTPRAWARGVESSAAVPA